MTKKAIQQFPGLHRISFNSSSGFLFNAGCILKGMHELYSFACIGKPFRIPEGYQNEHRIKPEGNLKVKRTGNGLVTDL